MQTSLVLKINSMFWHIHTRWFNKKEAKLALPYISYSWLYDTKTFQIFRQFNQLYDSIELKKDVQNVLLLAHKPRFYYWGQRFFLHLWEKHHSSYRRPSDKQVDEAQSNILPAWHWKLLLETWSQTINGWRFSSHW